MSAIAGIYHLNQEPINIEQSCSMMRVLEKFPADDIQIWHNDKVFFGCHAQWITPESIGEQLPYYDDERQLLITADAIIDNREELFERLQIKPGRQKTISDSELLLFAYDKWGEACPAYLVGDFAFMIWDERRQKLFGARDFSGSRTLYYYQDRQHFAFSTIIEPLLRLPYVEKKLNEQWLAEFLANPGMFESLDTSSTVYQYVRQIPPSHSITLEGMNLTLIRYCQLPEAETLRLKSNKEYEEAFYDVFNTAVTARLRTHHQVGAHLSGGLDSGSVASIAAKALQKENKKLHTYSYVPVRGFADWTPRSRVANERPFIEETVKYVGNINEEYLDFEGTSPLSVIDHWLEVLETPYKFFENTFWLKGIYEKAHQQGVGVLLNGQRGNWTVSWGPAIEFQVMLLKKLRWMRLLREIHLYSSNLGVNKSRVISAVRGKALSPLTQLFSSKNESHFPMLINEDFARRMNVQEKLTDYGIDVTGTKTPNWYQVRRKQFEQLFYWNITGTYGAKFSLPYAVWDRDPTNDLRMVRFSLSLPEEQCVQNGWDRAMIRRITKDLLPDKVRLNMRTRGAQGADGIYRMVPYWNTFIKEMEQLSEDSLAASFLNVDLIKNIITTFRDVPLPSRVYDPEFKILMRSLIFYRFIKRFA